MARSRLRARLLLVVLVVLVAQACYAEPAATSPTGPADSSAGDSGRSPASEAPSAPPASVPTSNVGAGWEQLAAFPEGGHILDGTGTDEGWVVVGLCTKSADCRDGVVAGALYSDDTRAWVEASVEDPGDTSWIDAVAWGNGMYVAAGTQFELGSGDQWNVVWQSEDRRSWDIVGRLVDEPCGIDDDCPTVQSIGITDTGAIVVAVSRINETPGPVLHRSDDGATWSTMFDFGSSHGPVTAGEAVRFGDRLVLVASACDSCALALWSSGDGRAWEEATFGRGPTSISRIAASPSHLVAAAATCPDEGPCRTELWVASDSSPWTLATTFPDITDVRLAFTGISFVMAGIDDSGRFIVARSLDGTTWDTVEPDLTLGDDCSVDWLAGHGGHVLLGDPDCDIWRSSDG